MTKPNPKIRDLEAIDPRVQYACFTGDDEDSPIELEEIAALTVAVAQDNPPALSGLMGYRPDLGQWVRVHVVWAEETRRGYLYVGEKNGSSYLTASFAAAPHTDMEARVRQASHIILEHGGYDGAHHKQYALDQALRALTGDEYHELIAKFRAGADGPDTYTWDEGVPA